MKKLLFVACLLQIVQFANAQEGPIAKGTVMANGGLAFFAGDGTTQFSLTPTIGFFVADNFAIGGAVGVSVNKIGEVKNNSFGLGPFARYYIGKTATKPFVVGEVNFLSNKAKSASGDEVKSNGTSFLFGLGFAAFVNETVAIEGLSGYNYTDYNTAEGTGGFALRFGFGLYFNRKHVKAVKTNVMGE